MYSELTWTEPIHLGNNPSPIGTAFFSYMCGACGDDWHSHPDAHVYTPSCPRCNEECAKLIASGELTFHDIDWPAIRITEEEVDPPEPDPDARRDWLMER